MADIANRYGENVTGKFYVDNQCIDCDLCRETAPDNFTRSEEGGYSYVFKQPGSPEEEARCKEAMEGCPVEAIGSNGDGAQIHSFDLCTRRRCACGFFIGFTAVAWGEHPRAEACGTWHNCLLIIYECKK